METAYTGRFEIMKARLAMYSLSVYRNILQDKVLKILDELLEHLDGETPSLIESVRLYGDLCSGLMNSGARMGLKEYIIEAILFDENPFTLMAECRHPDNFDEYLADAAKKDLAYLQTIASLPSGPVKGRMLECCTCDFHREAISMLPSWDRPMLSSLGNTIQPALDITELPSRAMMEEKAVASGIPSKNCHDAIKDVFFQAPRWDECLESLADFHRKWGSGIFSKYRAFVWERNGNSGYLRGVENPDPVTLADLVSYESERSAVVENTLQFIKGFPANNMLLYGDRGTGKSSTVKAILNEYYAMGLRVIEVPKRYLADFPAITGKLSGRKLKFIIFVDDLAFEDNEENYTALKAALEGGLEVRPPNVLIYATSNRRHLVKEKFSDRTGYQQGPNDDEVHPMDTMQEKLSLSDRFGMTVVFSSPDKQRYLEIVEGIAKQRNIRVDREFLHREALKWELWYNGRSPRTARQFVDWLEGYLGTRRGD